MSFVQAVEYLGVKTYDSDMEHSSFKFLSDNLSRKRFAWIPSAMDRRLRRNIL